MSRPDPRPGTPVGAEPHVEPRSGPGGRAGAGPLLVIVPALNEEASLPAVLADLRDWCPTVHVLVVDDGSTDATAAVAQQAGVAVASLPFNLGVGGALQTGFRYALRNGYRRAVQFDADGQHDALQIPSLLAGLDKGADLVIGSRFAPHEGPEPVEPYNVGWARRAAMHGLRVTVRALGGRTFSDASSGFRAFSAPVLEFFARRYPNYYLGDTAEALLLACHAGFRVVEVPVTMRARAGGEPSNTSAILAYHYLRAIVSMASRVPLRRARTGTTIP